MMYWNSAETYPTTRIEKKKKSILYELRGFSYCYGRKWYVVIWVYRFHNRSIAPKYFLNAYDITYGGDFFTGDVQISESRAVSRETLHRCFPDLLSMLKDFAGIRTYKGV